MFVLRRVEDLALELVLHAPTYEQIRASSLGREEPTMPRMFGMLGV